LSDGRNIYRALGAGFTLIALDQNDAVVGEFAQAAATLAVPLTIIRDTCSGGREHYGAGLVLVRPDQFVAWTGDSVSDAQIILRKAAGFGH
jgi:hypothetical protein